MYLAGRGVEGNAEEAAKWYRRAADQGNAQAQYNLGNLYLDGRGVVQDYKQALQWWRLAAAQGYSDAQYNIGVAYENGLSVPNDGKEAAKWYRLAADEAIRWQYSLGNMESAGDRFTEYVDAYKWFDLLSRFAAAERNAQGCRQQPRHHRSSMAGSNCRAQKRAQDWTAK
jgi:TPR repeat protein